MSAHGGWVLALALVAALTGCVGAPPAPSGSPTDPGPSPSASPSPNSIATPSTPPIPQVVGTPVDPADYDDYSDAGIAFSSPSRNIQCFYDSAVGHEWWSCALVDFTVALPSSAECTGTYSDGTPIVTVGFGLKPTDPTTTPTPVCGANPGFSQELLAVLPYGNSITYLDMACDSTEDGMRCWSLTSGHGFLLSRSTYELY